MPHELQKFAIAIVLSGKTERRSGRGLGIKSQYLDFSAHSTKEEEAYLYGGSLFLRRRLISTEEAHFYGGGLFLQRRLISTEEDHFHGGGSLLRGRLTSTEEANFYGGGLFL